MDNLKQRNYNRIFSGTNQSGGNENIHLGYQANTTEVILKKDVLNYFHVPFFTPVSSLTASTLLADGAEAGVIPAASDRIFKKQGNYGTHTNWGHNTGVQDGTWLCSWFCSLSGETPRWLDRYYDPAILTYDQALQGQTSFTTPYSAHDPAFADLPSRMTLEPGVLYQYFHIGEKASQEVVDTFAGDNKDKLRLKVHDFNSTLTDSSIYNNTGSIDNFNTIWSAYDTDTNYISGNFLDFNNTDFINAHIDYNDSYNLTDQFTFNLFVRHSDWSNATSSQLAGNMFESGFGLFYNNLNYYPYFVISENTYGHLFYYNQEGNAFLDVSTTESGELVSSNPVQISLDGERNIIVLVNQLAKNGTKASKVIKFNHTGNTVVTNSINVPADEEGKEFIIDKDNNITLYTTGKVYRYDKEFNLISTNNSDSYITNQKLTYDYTGLLRRSVCDALVYDNNNVEWKVISGGSGGVSINGIYNQDLPTNITDIKIDPNGNVWLLHDTVFVTIVDSNTYKTIRRFPVGKVHEVGVTERNLSFIKKYNRKNNTSDWYALFYYNYDKILYTTTLEGSVVNALSLNTSLDPIAGANQNKTLLTFTGKGDFTGYEWNRINNNILYKNIPQIQFKIATTNHVYGTPTLPYTISVPIQYFKNDNWYLITGSYSNHVMKLYIDTYLRDTLSIPGSKDITYKRKNDFFIGCPNGKSTNLNKEINSTSIIFNGQIDAIRIYDYEINSNFIQYFSKERIIGQDLIWNISTADLQYIETIERFFKHKMPGAKSQFFKIKLSGSQITDTNTRAIIEDYIKSLIEQTKPTYTELLSIEWV